MSEWISLETPTGRIRAWLAQPHVPPHGALVVVQEIFGVNAHIRQVCATFAEHGYVAMAPAFFDHFEHDVQLHYDADGVAHGRDLVENIGRRWPAVRIIRTSGYVWPSTREEEGNYLQKPFTSQELLLKVKQTLTSDASSVD